MSEKKSFIFLCDQTTESECVKNLLVGTTQESSLWAATIRVSDQIYLFNYNTGVIRGPYLASSVANCHDPTAWGGRFPIQVRISKSSITKKSDNHLKSAPSALRKRRPIGDLGPNANEVFAWIQKSGTSIE
jgi:hypothetical protein